MKKFLKYIFFALVVIVCNMACNKDGEITTLLKPEIEIEQNRYQLKSGESVELTPEVSSGDKQTTYVWAMQGVQLSTSLTYNFVADVEGTFLLTFTATNSAGSTSVDIRIDVMPLQPPVITFAVGEDSVFEMVKGRKYTIRPNIVSATFVTLNWKLDGKTIDSSQGGNNSSLELQFDEIADHTLTLKAENEDGATEREIILSVKTHVGDMIYIDQERHVALGRTLYLEPTLRDIEQASFEWSLGGEVLSSERMLKFTPTSQGEQIVFLKVSANGHTEQREIKIKCYPSEQESQRQPSAESQKACNKVYRYTPAPGQFINESESGFSGEQSPEQAAKYAERQLASGRYVSLGAWGGELVVGFDHSVTEGFTIAGNFYDGSSEAGIVWVAQDTNRNGVPDDEWYEMRGSEWGGENHSRMHAVKYYRTEDEKNILWRDNKGQTGCVYRNGIHTQASYYPAWITSQSYTLYGSLLAPNTVQDSDGKYINRAYAWGYADNNGEDATEAGANGEGSMCSFELKNAVNLDGSAAELGYIDFIRVQSAICHTAGELGEISTEVTGVFAK